MTSSSTASNHPKSDQDAESAASGASGRTKKFSLIEELEKESEKGHTALPHLVAIRGVLDQILEAEAQGWKLSKIYKKLHAGKQITCSSQSFYRILKDEKARIEAEKAASVMRTPQQSAPIARSPEGPTRQVPMRSPNKL